MSTVRESTANYSDRITFVQVACCTLFIAACGVERSSHGSELEKNVRADLFKVKYGGVTGNDDALTAGKAIAGRYGAAAVGTLEELVLRESEKDDCCRGVTLSGCVALAHISHERAAFDALGRLYNSCPNDCATAMPLMAQSQMQELLKPKLEVALKKTDSNVRSERIALAEVLCQFGDASAAEWLTRYAERTADARFESIVEHFLVRRRLVHENVKLSEDEILALEREFWFAHRGVVLHHLPWVTWERAVEHLRSRAKVPVEYMIATTYACRLRLPYEASGAFALPVAREFARQSLADVMAIARDDTRPAELRQQAIELIATMKARDSLSDIYRNTPPPAGAWVAESILRQYPERATRLDALRPLLVTLGDDERLPKELRESISKRLAVKE